MGRGPKTGPTGQLVQREQRSEKDDRSLAGMVKSMLSKGHLADALPRHITPDRIARVALTALRTTKGLAECSRASFFGAMMSTAQLGLEPNGPLGLSWIVPYGREATLIVGYQGMIELAMRSGRVNGIQARVVRKGDVYDLLYGTEEHIRHVPSDLADRDEQPITHVYGIARIKGADPIFEPLSIAQVEKRKLRSPANRKGGGPWKTDYEAMVRKTAIRSLFKMLPKSPEVQRVEALEAAPELGRSQTSAYSFEVQETLASEGFNVNAEGVEVIDAETGEVVEQAPASGEAAAQ